MRLFFYPPQCLPQCFVCALFFFLSFRGSGVMSVVGCSLPNMTRLFSSPSGFICGPFWVGRVFFDVDGRAQQVTIVPRGASTLGYAQYLPKEVRPETARGGRRTIPRTHNPEMGEKEK